MHEKKTSIPAAAAANEIPGSPTVVSVPWDPKALDGRDCGACACYFEQANPENPSQSQGFCRRAPADMQSMRGMEPRRDLKGNVVMRDGQPVMQPTQIIGYLFKTTRREGTCFDGWRPLGTLPGERQIDTTMRLARDSLRPLLAELPESLRPFMAALFGSATGETEN